jgi:hypothetical protein
MGAPQQMAEVGAAWPRRRCPWQTAGARCEPMVRTPRMTTMMTETKMQWMTT